MCCRGRSQGQNREFLLIKNLLGLAFLDLNFWAFSEFGIYFILRSSHLISSRRIIKQKLRKTDLEGGFKWYFCVLIFFFLRKWSNKWDRRKEKCELIKWIRNDGVVIWLYFSNFLVWNMVSHVYNICDDLSIWLITDSWFIIINGSNFSPNMIVNRRIVFCLLWTEILILSNYAVIFKWKLK